MTLEVFQEVPLNALLDTFMPHTHAQHPDMRVRVAAHLVLQSGSPLEKIKLAMLGAASSGTIGVYVKSRQHAYYHEIYPQIWCTIVPPVIDPVAMALTGKYLAYREILPSASLDAELACTDLVICSRDFAKLKMAKAASRAALIAHGREIIDEAIRKELHESIRREDFLNLMRRNFSGTSDRELLRVWKQIAPTELRKGGRRPGRR